jgi:predicted nucleotidyltransferase
MFLDKYMGDINRLCRENGVKTLYAFGSVLTDKFSDKSDVDLLIDIQSDDPLEYGRKYFNFLFALQDMLSRPIDLLEDRAIKNKYLRSEIDRTKKMIYG